MLSFSAILAAAFPVYLTMGIGALLRRVRFLPQEVDPGMMRLVVTVLSPCLILDRLVGNQAVMSPGPVLIAALLGFILVVFGVAVSYAAAPLAGLRVGQGRRTFAMSCGLQNYGFIAIPIVTALFPDKGTVGVLFTFTLGVELGCWIAGVGTLTGWGNAPWRHALNPPVFAILGGLALNFSGLHAFIPSALSNTFHMIGACAVPLAVLLIGAAIADILGHEKMRWSVALLSPVLRLALIPSAFIAAACWLPVTPELKRVLIVQGAMPSAVFSIMVAKLYGGHSPTAVQVVLSTTLVSMLTSPLVIAWALKLTGV
jgi:malate permease and related proteins